MNFPADGPVMQKKILRWEPSTEKMYVRDGMLKGDVAMQGHSTNNFGKMHCSIQYDKKKSCLRHFRVFFCIAGKKLSVPFSQQLVHSRFRSQQN